MNLTIDITPAAAEAINNLANAINGLKDSPLMQAMTAGSGDKLSFDLPAEPAEPAQTDQIAGASGQQEEATPPAKKTRKKKAKKEEPAEQPAATGMKAPPGPGSAPSTAKPEQEPVVDQRETVQVIRPAQGWTVADVQKTCGDVARVTQPSGAVAMKRILNTEFRAEGIQSLDPQWFDHFMTRVDTILKTAPDRLDLIATNDDPYWKDQGWHV